MRASRLFLKSIPPEHLPVHQPGLSLSRRARKLNRFRRRWRQGTRTLARSTLRWMPTVLGSGLETSSRLHCCVERRIVNDMRSVHGNQRLTDKRKDPSTGGRLLLSTGATNHPFLHRVCGRGAVENADEEGRVRSVRRSPTTQHEVLMIARPTKLHFIHQSNRKGYFLLRPYVYNRSGTNSALAA
jgi:hypothetical protein